MPRIKIGDLPESMKVSKEDMRKVLGGVGRIYLDRLHQAGTGGYFIPPQSMPSGEEEEYFFSDDELKSG